MQPTRDLNADAPSRKTLIQLNHEEALNFLLKSSSYCNFDFPPYIKFDKLLERVSDLLNKNKLCELSEKPRNHDKLNHIIMCNKDGKYAWRPLQIIHPVLYVSLAHELTKEDNWKFLQNRFREFSSNEKIACLSVPVVSLSKETDKAEQISKWWQEIEQRSIELSLDYEYLLDTDITDCYESIYTHSLAWAIHGKTKAKQKRTDKFLLGNVIDSHIQDMSNGQTNGIPQGSVMMDFLAEIVFGLADLELSDKIKESKIDDYFIIRYRDDYRIFVNNPQDGERIFKILTETMIDLGLKLNIAKTKSSSEVIRASIKPEKLAWVFRKNSEKSVQKNLLIIHDHACNHPNSGSLVVALNHFFKRIRSRKALPEPIPLIAIVADIAFKNPRTHAICAAILSKIINFLKEDDVKIEVSKKIKNRFDRIPNTGHIQIWIQRITYPIFKEMKFKERVCNLVSGEKIYLWNCDWITSKELKKIICETEIVNREVLEKMKSVIPISEVELFSSKIY